MAEEKQLRVWISDNLHAILGFSEPNLVHYLSGLGKRASSAQELTSELVKLELPSSSETVRFAEELFGRFSRRATGPNSYKQAEREAAALVRKQKQYQLLDDDDDDIGQDVVRSSLAAEKQVKKGDGDAIHVRSNGSFSPPKKGPKHIRKRAADTYDDEDDVGVGRFAKERRIQNDSDDEDEDDE
eukprot:c19630_g1_i1 orf=1-552(-)